MILTREDFLKHLSDQIYFLQRSAENYDMGMIVEAKSMATNIRILLHDTRNSTSLLKHLDSKLGIYYYNTAIPDTKFGLCGITTTTIDGGKTFFNPPLNNLSEIRLRNPWVTFNTWWNEMNVLSDGNNRFSRKDLVLALANKDGGAHVDNKLDQPYSELTRNNSLEVFHQEHSGKLIDVAGVEFASIRQITFELLTTLEKKFSAYFK
jgi:hypothetical protein